MQCTENRPSDTFGWHSPGSAAPAQVSLYTGANDGKVLVRVAE